MELITPGLGLIFWMTVSFAMVLIILRKYAWRPILANIRARERTIARSLITARRMEEEMIRLERKKVERMAEIDSLSVNMMKQAQDEAEQVLDKARKKAAEEAAAILGEADRIIASQKHAALLEIRNQVASLSLDMAEKLIQQEFSDKEKSVGYVNRLLDQVVLN